MSKHPITDKVIEQVFQRRTELSLTGTRFGPSHTDWDNAILDDLLESKQGLPKCTRDLRFDSKARLEAINAHRSVL